MNKYVIITMTIISTLFFTGCDENKIIKLEEGFTNTKLGTIQNQELVTKIIVPKPIVVKKVKKVPLSVQQKKQRFKDILVPIATEVYNTLYNQYIDVKRDIEQNINREFIEKMKVEYRAKNDEELLYALKPHPISILLAQGAIESAWLTSRFTVKENNIFGVWSFNKNEPRIEANATRGEKKIYLRKYKTYKAAIFHYYKNLAKNRAYKEFRKQRTLTDDPYELVQYLGSYSEKKEIYTNTLKKMIEYNKFYEYDIKR